MAINSKSTKAEILAAYKALDKEKKSWETAQKQNTKTRNSNNSFSKKNVTNTVRVDSFIDTISQQGKQRDIDKIVKVLEEIQIGFGGAVSSLSEKLITEATTLSEIKELIAKEQQQLLELHDIKAVKEETIERLIEKYQINYKKFSEEFELESENKQQELANLIEAWNKEKEAHKQKIAARNEERRKNKQRDEEEYQYNLDLARDLDEEEYEQEKKEKYQILETTRQELEEQWQTKEAEITNEEQEYSKAKAMMLELEEKLRRKTKQGLEEGKGIGSYQAKIKHNLRTKEIEGERQNYQLRIQAFEQTISSQKARIAKLIQQLDAAQEQVQDLAVKAIEGTASKQSYEAIKEIAMEQAKTQQKGK